MADKFARYKGKTYRLLWRGKTAHGERAKLGFIDGSKEFWVDDSLIREVDADQGVCAECGRPGPLVADLEDGLLKHRNCCDIAP